jgi:phosphatidate cytidylyltransferase
MRAELRNRLIMGPTLIAILTAALAWDFSSGRHLGFLAILFLSVFFGVRELQRMAGKVVGPVQILPTLVVSWLLVLLTWVAGDAHAMAWLAERVPRLATALRTAPVTAVLLAIGMVWIVLTQMRRSAFDHFFSNVGLSVFGLIYMGLTAQLMLCLAMVHGSVDYYGESYANRGNQLLLMYLASCKLGDVTAYFGGRAFGRHKMTPSISPGKTWEGFAFSFVGAIGGAYALAAIFTATCAHGPFNGWWQPLVWGVIIGPLGVVGDLAESCMKRQAEVKDSGASLPGFGGFLDVFDALILAAPAAYVLALLL